MYENELYHHGIKGMKWGVRRFQTKDGGLTSAGRKRYSDAEQDYRDKKAAYKSAKKDYNKAYFKADSYRHQAFSLSKKKRDANTKRWEDVFDKGKAEIAAKKDYKKAKAAYKAEKKSARKQSHEEVSKKVKDIISKNANTPAKRLASTNAALSGMRAVDEILKGNVLGAAYYGRNSKRYRNYVRDN